MSSTLFVDEATAVFALLAAATDLVCLLDNSSQLIFLSPQVFSIN